MKIGPLQYVYVALLPSSGLTSLYEDSFSFVAVTRFKLGTPLGNNFI